MFISVYTCTCLTQHHPIWLLTVIKPIHNPVPWITLAGATVCWESFTRQQTSTYSILAHVHTCCVVCTCTCVPTCSRGFPFNLYTCITLHTNDDPHTFINKTPTLYTCIYIQSVWLILPPEMRTPWLSQILCAHYNPWIQDAPLIKTLFSVLRVSGLEMLNIAYSHMTAVES